MIRSIYSCRTLRYVIRSTVGIFMNYRFIQRCPEEARYSQECEANFIYKTLAHRLPVCHPSSSLLFANRFCAACHGFNFEDTVSFYHRIPVCDKWLALNHTKEKLLENVTGAYELYKLCSVEWTDFPPNDCIVSIVRNRCHDRYNNPQYDKDIGSQCSLLMNPVFTRTRENEIITVKYQHCFSNSSMPWQCYYEGTVPTFPNPPSADWSNAVEFWVDRNGTLRVKSITTDKATRENRGNCFSTKPFLLILPLTVMGMNILAR